MTLRFLHSSDLHLGKPYGGYSEAIRGRLREARHGAIARLAQAAREAGAAVILMAGDSFDAETPAPDTLRHALRAMAEAGDITWIMLPGNHDSLAATELWRRIAADGPANLRAVTDSQPFPLAPGAFILPSPCTRRRPGRDLTESMAAATPEGVLRIGLGHGAITDFSEECGDAGIIPPDRAALSGLDYLALGDWHGRMQVGPRTWYSGTPEADSFKHQATSGALIVTLDGDAKVEVVETGLFSWTTLALDLLPGDDAAAMLTRVLPMQGRRDMLMRLVATGRLPLAARSALEAALARLAPDFGWFDQDLSALTTEAHPADLDQIDSGGALRHAAEALLAESASGSLPAAEREIAAAGLARLYSITQEVQQ